MKFLPALFVALEILIVTSISQAEPPKASLSKATSPESFKAFCEKNPCQKNLKVKLQKSDGSIYEKTMELFPPSVQPSFISIVAGQTLYLEAKVSKGKFVGFRTVDRVENAQTTIVAQLTQQANRGMLLPLNNPFARPIRFRMAIMPLDSQEAHQTSSCPIMKEGGSFESWPEPLFQVFLSDAQFLEEGDDMGCR